MRYLMTLFASLCVAMYAVAGNDWQMNVEANSDQIPQFTREFARGELWNISPLVTDNGKTRAWPTNATFIFFWQRQNMTTNWWASTNVVYPVYHSVTIGTTSPVVTLYITNLTVVTYETTNSGGTTNYFSSTNLFTSYVASYTNVSVIDTGRVSAVWVAGMDAGAQSYNWFLGEFENGNPCYRVNGTITMRGSPGYGGTFTGNPIQFPWATTNFVTNFFGQVSAYSLRVVTNGAPAGYYYLQTPGH